MAAAASKRKPWDSPLYLSRMIQTKCRVMSVSIRPRRMLSFWLTVDIHRIKVRSFSSASSVRARKRGSSGVWPRLQYIFRGIVQIAEWHYISRERCQSAGQSPAQGQRLDSRRDQNRNRPAHYYPAAQSNAAAERAEEISYSNWIFPEPDSAGDAGQPSIRSHDLRHIFAAMSLENGMDVKTLPAIIGHVPSGCHAEHLHPHNRRDTKKCGTQYRPGHRRHEGTGTR